MRFSRSAMGLLCPQPLKIFGPVALSQGFSEEIVEFTIVALNVGRQNDTRLILRDAETFRENALGMRPVVEAEVGDDQLKRFIGEWFSSAVSLDEINVGQPVNPHLVPCSVDGFPPDVKARQLARVAE